MISMFYELTPCKGDGCELCESGQRTFHGPVPAPAATSGKTTGSFYHNAGDRLTGEAA